MKSLSKLGRELLPILALMAVCFVIGLITVRDYGESWDESTIYRYSDYTINAYQYFFHPQSLAQFDTNLNLYGPAYFMVVSLFTRFLTAIHSQWSGPIAWHFSYFLTFLICVMLLYLFSQRWFSHYTSFAVCLLFVSQPLFWGHAFINPKDLPLMAFFLASVYLGFEMADRFFSPQPNYLLVVCAALMLGLTISFRPSGLLAALIVGIYAITKSLRKALPLLILYLLLASITTYLTWPFLWGAPLTRFMESVGTMAKFPFPAKVLFMGQYYQGNELPWFYYPVMLGIQLTEPVILLALAGLCIVVRNYLMHKEKAKAPLVLFISWFLLPVVAIVGLNSTLYDNGRQLFFLLPPLFLLVGESLESLIGMLPSRWMIAGVVLLFMIPGVYASIRLHPYEYIYYNSFVGGTGSAYKQYEMDYWGTSYQEVVGWLNEHAAPDSTIWVTGPTHLLQLNLRPDIKLSCTSDIDCGDHYDYIVTLARWKAERECRGSDTVFSVRRAGALFSIVKQLPPGRLCR